MLVLEECPFCHRLFAAEQVSKEEIDSTVEDLLHDPPTMGGGRRYGLFNQPPVEFFTTYKVLYRCKQCGKEWTKTSMVEKDVSRRIAGPEQASDADVASEEEEAKEEEYARE